MKHAVIILWNSSLFLVVIFCAWAILPRAMRQFPDLDQIQFGTFKARVIMIGFEGFGLFLAIAATAESLSSYFWRVISRRWRIGFTVALGVLSIGTVVAIGITYLDLGKYYPSGDFASLYGDLIAFFVSVCLSLLPLVLFGRSYPNLLFSAVSRIRPRDSQAT